MLGGTVGGQEMVGMGCLAKWMLPVARGRLEPEWIADLPSSLALVVDQLIHEMVLEWLTSHTS
jgi:hypothetical protein